MQLTKSKKFLFSCLFLIIGVGVASFLPEKIIGSELLWFSGVIVCLVFLILLWPRRGGAPARRFYICTGLLFITFFLLGVWRYSIALPDNTPDKILYYNGKTVAVQGVVSNEPDRRKRSQKLEVDTKRLFPEEGPPPVLSDGVRYSASAESSDPLQTRGRN